VYVRRTIDRMDVREGDDDDEVATTILPTEE
jgi:hypothetical protein